MAASAVRPPGEREIVPALRANRGVWRVVGDDAKRDRRARGVDIGDHAQWGAFVGEHERRGESQIRQRHIFGRQVGAQLRSERAQFDRLQLGVGAQRRKRIIRIHVRVFSDSRAPVLAFLEQPKARRNPCGCGSREEPDGDAGRKLSQTVAGGSARRLANGCVHGNRRPQALQGRLAEEFRQ